MQAHVANGASAEGIVRIRARNHPNRPTIKLSAGKHVTPASDCRDSASSFIVTSRRCLGSRQRADRRNATIVAWMGFMSIRQRHTRQVGHGRHSSSARPFEFVRVVSAPILSELRWCQRSSGTGERGRFRTSLRCKIVRLRVPGFGVFRIPNAIRQATHFLCSAQIDTGPTC